MIEYIDPGGDLLQGSMTTLEPSNFDRQGVPSMMIWPIDRPMISACILTMLLGSADAAAQQQRDGSFGFSDLKVFRLGSAGGPWHVTDLDGDGDTDLVVWVGEKVAIKNILENLCLNLLSK